MTHRSAAKHITGCATLPGMALLLYAAFVIVKHVRSTFSRFQLVFDLDQDSVGHTYSQTPKDSFFKEMKSNFGMFMES